MTHPKQRKMYRGTKRLLIRRFLKWYDEVANWDLNHQLQQPRILKTNESIAAVGTLVVLLTSELVELEPLPGQVQQGAPGGSA
jgi:hypothetical protein